MPWQCLNFITLVLSFVLTTDIPQNSHPRYLKRPKNEAEFCFVLRDLHSRIEILRRGVVCHMAPPLLFISTASHRSSSSSIITDQSHKCLWRHWCSINDFLTFKWDSNCEYRPLAMLDICSVSIYMFSYRHRRCSSSHNPLRGYPSTLSTPLRHFVPKPH